MKTGWIVAGAIGLIIVAFIISKRAPIQTRPTIPPRSPLTPISSQPIPLRDYGKCICVNGSLAGPECHAVGVSCAHAKRQAQINSNCECINNIATGAQCPVIGKPCGMKLKYPSTYKNNGIHPISPDVGMSPSSPYSEQVA